MTEPNDDTRAMLARHHRDGARFAELMKESFEGRFNDEFWSAWSDWIGPRLGAGDTVLDLGTGPGLFLRELVRRYPGVQAVGIEYAPWMLEAVGKLPEGCEIISADLHDPALPFEDGSVAAALASVVLHEMNQPVRALREVHRCLRPGGRLLVLDWVRTPLETYLAHESDEARVFSGEMSVGELEDLFIHFIEHNRFSAQDLAYLLESTGFEVVDAMPLNEGRFARLIATKT